MNGSKCAVNESSGSVQQALGFRSVVRWACALAVISLLIITSEGRYAVWNSPSGNLHGQGRRGAIQVFRGRQRY